MAEALSRQMSVECASCGKPASLCICAEIVPIDNRIAVLILQHPQEQDRELGTARLTALHLRKAVLKIGLSWPSLAKALGRAATPRHWAVLYLGSARATALPPGHELVVLDAKGAAAGEARATLTGVEGIVLLDGSWSQAKTLWWRNPWLLKCPRLVLNPLRPSAYGELRREPRREGMATIEAAAYALSRLEARPEIEAALNLGFARLIDRFRAARPAIPQQQLRGKRRRFRT